VSAEVSPIEGTRDWGPTGESKWTLFGSFCTRQLLRDSTGPAGSLLWAYSGEKWVKTPPRGAELTIGLQEVVYYCEERRRPMTATLTAF
jgi:hypothetical protein